MSQDITSIAVIGGGTMGSGIAAASAAAGRRVLILDVDSAAAEKAKARALATAQTPEEAESLSTLISVGTIESDLAQIADYDWICEAIIEDLETKRRLFTRLEPLRGEGSVVSTNTSGIPLRDITEGLPARLRRDIVVTHFFNPVRIMRLLEIIPGADTDPKVVERIANFGRSTLGKGVVNAKDTVNFIGNRIGCFWMLSGLHKAASYLNTGLSIERIDALMGGPVGLPSTGLYGLIDLIGLDVMDFVGKNLAANLPKSDVGLPYTSFPADVQGLLEKGQLGRKTGCGFYRVLKQADGSKLKQVYDIKASQWRDAQPTTLTPPHDRLETLLFAADAEGRFTWDLLGGAILYAADLLPEIADDIVNVDRAMRWGFAWQKGPFELLDAAGPSKVITKLEAEGKPLPKLLAVLKAAGGVNFYRNDGHEYLTLDGTYKPVRAE